MASTLREAFQTSRVRARRVPVLVDITKDAQHRVPSSIGTPRRHRCADYRPDYRSQAQPDFEKAAALIREGQAAGDSGGTRHHVSGAMGIFHQLRKRRIADCDDARSAGRHSPPAIR